MNKIVFIENQVNQLISPDLNTIRGIQEISKQVKDHLRLPKEPISWVASDLIYINGIIGNLSLDELNLVILPKIQSGTADSDAYKEALNTLLTRTLCCAKDKIYSVVYFSRKTILDDQEIFVEALARYFIDYLSLAIKKSFISTYQSFDSKTDNIRGHILLQKQLSEPMTDARIWCRYRRFTNNNAYNSLLLWACRYLADLVTDSKIKRQLQELARNFTEANVELSYQTVSKLILPRQYIVFSESFAIAKDLYLGNKGRKESHTNGNQICGYVISTERAFERIVEFYCRNAAKELGYSFRAQAKVPFANSLYSSQFDYNIMPDDIVFTDKACLVLDAKYKIVTPFGIKHNRPVREDIYQIICSCIAHKSHEAILVYPCSDGSIPMTWRMIEEINKKKIVISSGFIDIYGSEQQLNQAFIDMLRNTEFYGVTVYGTDSAS